MYFSLNIYRYSTAHPASVYSALLQECTVLQECTLHDKFWPPLKTTPPQLGVDTMKHCAALLQGAMAWYCSVASSDSVSLGQDWQYHETSRISNKACWPISAMFSAPPLVGMGACCVSARLVPHGVDFTCCVYFYILCTLATRWMMKWKLSEDDLSMRWLGWLCWARRCCSPTASTPPSTLPSMGAGASSSRIFRWVDIS